MKNLPEEIRKIIKPDSYDVLIPGIILAAQIRDLSALFRKTMLEIIGEDNKESIYDEAGDHNYCVNCLRDEQRERNNKLR